MYYYFFNQKTCWINLFKYFFLLRKFFEIIIKKDWAIWKSFLDLKKILTKNFYSYLFWKETNLAVNNMTKTLLLKKDENLPFFWLIQTNVPWVLKFIMLRRLGLMYYLFNILMIILKKWKWTKVLFRVHIFLFSCWNILMSRKLWMWLTHKTKMIYSLIFHIKIFLSTKIINCNFLWAHNHSEIRW